MGSLRELSNLFCKGYEVKYDRAGIQFLEKYINEKINQETDEQERDVQIYFATCFLGETMIENYGGDWIEDFVEIKLSGGFRAFPYNSILKQHKDPDSYSIVTTYDFLSTLVRRPLPKI